MTEFAEVREFAGAFWMIPVLGLVAILGEWLYVRFVAHLDDAYEARETAGSVGVAAIDYTVRPIFAGLMVLPIFWTHQHRLFDIPWQSVIAAVALVIVADFMDYWFHRASHRVRALWAIHLVHHSSTRINLSAAIRTSCLAPIVSTLYWVVPLVFLGFHPIVVVVVVNAIQLYQFTLHSARVPSWGPLEWVMNTPTHHRVHHAINPSCFNRNFGALFIVWDRMFGTFAVAPKGEKLVFGLLQPISSQNPFRIHFQEPIRMVIDVFRASGLRAGVRVLIGD